MKTQVTYTVEIGLGAILSPDGYSKYTQRLAMAERNEIKRDDVYGKAQAEEHIKEYYDKQDDYAIERRKCKLKLVRTVSLIEVLDTFSCGPIERKPLAPVLFKKGDIVRYYMSGDKYIVTYDQSECHVNVCVRPLSHQYDESLDQYVQPINLIRYEEPVLPTPPPARLIKEGEKPKPFKP